VKTWGFGKKKGESGQNKKPQKRSQVAQPEKPITVPKIKTNRKKYMVTH